MFRSLPQLTKIACVSLVVGCASPEELKAPPSSNGGNTAVGVGGSDATGGSSATQTAASDTGGAAVQTGGSGSGQGGKAATGGARADVGGGATGGATSSAPAVKLSMTWKKGASDQASEVSITLPAGAETIMASRVSMKLCGQGNAAMIKANDITFDQATLMCTSAQTPADCNYGSNFSLKDGATAMVITVSGIARDCCYEFDLSKMNHSLAVGGKIFLVYRFQTDGSIIGMNYTNGAVWEAYVDGELSASCTLAPWPATTTTCT